MRCFFAIVVALLAVMDPAASALAAKARVTWLAGAASQPAGYLILTRRPGHDFGQPLDVGPATLEADGTVNTVVSGLLAGPDYHFAVIAYLADGTRSPRSNELALSDSGGGRSGGGFAIRHATVRRTKHLVRFAARGAATLPVPDGTDQGDVHVFLQRPDGGALIDQALEPSALHRHGHRRSYRVRPGSGDPTEPVVEWLSVAVHRYHVGVSLHVAIPLETDVPSEIGWRMQVGLLTLSRDLICQTGRRLAHCH